MKENLEWLCCDNCAKNLNDFTIFEDQITTQPYTTYRYCYFQDDEKRTQSVYQGDFYMTGDKAVRDDDGYFWFVGRADDIILTAG